MRRLTTPKNKCSRLRETTLFKNCSQKLLKTLSKMTCKKYRCRLVHAKRYVFSETCVSSTRNTTFSPQSGRGFVAGLLLRSAVWPFDSPRTESQKFMSASCRRNAYFFSPAKSEGHPISSINLKAWPAPSIPLFFRASQKRRPKREIVDPAWSSQ